MLQLNNQLFKLFFFFVRFAFSFFAAFRLIFSLLTLPALAAFLFAVAAVVAVVVLLLLLPLAALFDGFYCLPISGPVQRSIPPRTDRQLIPNSVSLAHIVHLCRTPNWLASSSSCFLPLPCPAPSEPNPL